LASRPKASPAARGSRPSGAATRPKSSDPLSAIGRFLPLPLPVPDWSKPIILLLLVLAGGLAVRSRLATIRARGLAGEREELVHDLDAMQDALVPSVPAQLRDLGLSVAYRPADGPAAGGDFYDAFPVGENGVAILLGDASGHGREALARSALTRYTLRAYVEAGLEPRAALKLAGQVLSGENGEEFTTIAVALYDSTAGTLTYAAAGHPPPILLGPSAHEPVTACSSPPVGWDAPTGRRQTTVTLPAGALACFFSDGLTESRAAGRMLGRDGLARILAELGPGPSAAALLERVRANADEAPDDMAACILLPGPGSASTAPGTRTEALELDAAELAGPKPERFLLACGIPDGETPTVLAQARKTAAQHGAALLRVRLDAAGSCASAVPPTPARTVTGADSPAGLGQLLSA